MQTTDNLEGGAAPEFRETGIDAEMGKAKPSKGDIGNGREVPENKDSAQDAAGVQDGPPGSSPPESNSKRSEIDESEELERGLNQSRGSPAIKSGDDGQAEFSDQLRSPFGSQTREQAGRQAAHSGGSTSGEECEESGKARVQAVDANHSLAESAETDQDGETPAAVSSALSNDDADTAPVRKGSGNPNAANGASKERPSPESMHQEPLAHEEACKLIHGKKADLPESEVSETGIAAQPELAPPNQDNCSQKSERVSEPKQKNLESGLEATETSGSLKSPAANSSDPAEQAAVNNEDAPIGPQQGGSGSEQTDGQSGSEVLDSERDGSGSDVQDDRAAHSITFSEQRFDAIAERVARRDDEEVGSKLEDLTDVDEFAAIQNPGASFAARDGDAVDGTLEDPTEDSDFAAIQSPGAALATAGEGDQCVSMDFGSHSSLSANVGNSDIQKETPKIQEPAGGQVGDNSRRGRRAAARILAAGALASACIFASKQFGATAWLNENAQKIRAQYSLPLPNSSDQPSDGPESSIGFIGDGEGRSVEVEIGPDSYRESVGDFDSVLRITEGPGSMPAVDQEIGNVGTGPEYSAMSDGEAASTRTADWTISEGTDASALEPSKIGGIRNAPSEIRSLDGARGTATIKTESELASAGAANPEDLRVFKLDAAVVERNADGAIQLHAASASGSRVAQSSDDGQAFSEEAGDIEEGRGRPLEVGILQNISGNGMSGKPRESAQQVSLSGDNRSSPSENSASPLSDEIASIDPIPDASVEAATADGSIFDHGDYPNSANLNSLRSELESEFAEIHSRFDFMAARFDLLFAGHESGPALRGETEASGAPVFESHDDANVASEMNCQHSPDRSRQNCEAGSRAGKSSQPYLIATAPNAADGEFAMPELGYGVVLDVLKDSAGGWLIVMENATLRLD